MQNVSRTLPLFQMTPQERVRQQVAARLIPKIAELLLQADKGSESIKLTDLRSEESRCAYLADALLALEPEQRFERVKRVHQADAEMFALQADEDEMVRRQARRDIARFGGQPFDRTQRGPCHICRQRIAPADAYTLQLSPTLTVDVHGTCCANDQRFELLSAFSFRLIEGGAQ